MTSTLPRINEISAVHLPAGRYQSLLGYANERGITAVGVLKRIKRGEVKAYRVGRAWIIKLDKEKQSI